MTQIHVSSQLAGTARLWRYMSLDKFVDLLSTQELFFTPLASFADTDPYEGYLPKVALDAHASINKNIVAQIENAHKQLADNLQKRGRTLSDEEQQTLETQLENLRSSLCRIMPAIAKTIMVNCWHVNEDESEAMWRLYSENGKAVAIETTLAALSQSIELKESSRVVYIYPVKYLDFFDSNLEPRDCVVEGHLAPLLKRRSYQHEREVRAFIAKMAPDPRTGADVSFWKPESVRVPIDLQTLVKAVHISPYATAPFPSSVLKICELSGLGKSRVQQSKLLNGHEELLERLRL
jgi:hypothetical protein